MRAKARFQKCFKKCLLRSFQEVSDVSGSECLNILKSNYSLGCLNVLPCMLLLPNEPFWSYILIGSCRQVLYG